eukprot:529086_1
MASFISFNMFVLLTTTMIHAQIINDFQYFLMNLPIQLDSHISTIFNQKLYVFGGYKNPGTNTDFYSLDLSAFDFKLNENRDDIIAQGSSNWVQITSNVILPDYGATTGSFICSTQCSVLIDNFLYIFKGTGQMYRVEITDNQLIFANSTQINYTTPYNINGACITSDGNDVYWMKNSQFGMFNVSTQQHHLLTNLKYSRWESACSFDRKKEKIYQFGGESSSSNPLYAIDWYTISTNNWTNHDGRNDLGACGKCDWGWRCLQHPFYDLIECTDGFGGVTWNTSSNSRIYSSATQNRNYDLTLYHLNSDTVIVLVTGGWTGSAKVNYIRYSVIDIGVNPTVEPTNIPTVEPTFSDDDYICSPSKNTGYINTTYQIYLNNSCENTSVIQFADEFIHLITILYSNNDMDTYSTLTNPGKRYTYLPNITFTISTCFADQTNVTEFVNYTTSYAYQHAVNIHYNNCMSIIVKDIVYNTIINNTFYVTQFIENEKTILDSTYIWIIILCLIFLFIVFIFIVVKYKRYRQRVKAERDKKAVWIKNPMVLAIAIESYDDEELNDLNGIDNDIRNIYNLFELNLNYTIIPVYNLSVGLKLKWTQNEIMQFLVQNAEQLKDNLKNNQYDGLVVFISAHGVEHNIISSDGFEIQTDVIHRIFSSQYANVRSIPRIFIFDSCCDIDEKVDEKNENNIMDLKALEEKYGAETWETGEDNVDNLLMTITASNIGYQSKMNNRQGSYFIKEFCVAIEQNICNNNNELFLGEIFSQVQSSLHKRGLQLPEMKANNNTQFVKFALNKQRRYKEKINIEMRQVQK